MIGSKIFTRSQVISATNQGKPNSCSRLKNKSETHKNGKTSKMLTKENSNNNIMVSKHHSKLQNKPENTHLMEKELWFHDLHIEAYFKSFQEYVSLRSDDILVFGPIVSQFLKSTNTYEMLDTLNSLSFESVNIALFCINNHTEDETSFLRSKKQHVNPEGTHWSLLIFDRHRNSFFHYDSIQGLNYNHALKLSKIINSDFHVIEKETIQQTDSFSCGLHLIINAKTIIDSILSEGTHFKKLSHSINHKINDHGENLEHRNLLNTKSFLGNFDSSLESTQQIKPLVEFETSKPNEFHLVNNTNLNVHTKPRKKYIKHSKTFEVKCSNRFTPLDSIEVSCMDRDLQNVNLVKSSDITVHHSKKPSIKKGITGNSTDRESAYGNIMNSPESCNVSLSFHKEPMVIETEKCKPSITLLADSHGRKIGEILRKELPNSFNVQGIIKPNGKMGHILNQFDSEVKNMDKNDFVIISGGTNDIDEFLNVNALYNEVKSKITKCLHTNIIISAVPYRYDKPGLNKIIRKVNFELNKLSYIQNNVYFLSLHFIKSFHYTNYGLHLNFLGKNLYTNQLMCLINNNNNIPVIVTNRHPVRSYKQTKWYDQKIQKTKKVYNEL